MPETPDRRSPAVFERFAKFVCPTRCGGSAVEIREDAGRVWICTMCHEDAVSAEFVTLDASDFDCLRAENARLRAALSEAEGFERSAANDDSQETTP